MELSTSLLCPLCSLSDETTTYLFSECNIIIGFVERNSKQNEREALTLPDLNDRDVYLRFLTEESGSF